MLERLEFTIQRRQTVSADSLVLVHSKNKAFMGVGEQDFKERDKLKNRAETGKCSIFQGFEDKFLQFVREW